MLEVFLNYWYEQDADIITAWNLSFDVDYLLARLQQLGISDKKLSQEEDSDFNDVTNFFTGSKTNKSIIKRTNGEVEILGLVLFDMLKAYRKMHFGELRAYDLNSIAVDELNEKKEKVYNTGKVWREDL
ncbi:unnamed protein product, partial [marine sediment metagenome]